MAFRFVDEQPQYEEQQPQPPQQRQQQQPFPYFQQPQQKQQPEQQQQFPQQQSQQPKRFRFVDEQNFPEDKNTISNPFASQGVSGEQYKNMSLVDKIKHSKEYVRELEERQSKSMVKSFANRASWGATEGIPGFEPSEEDEPNASAFGALTGEILPITASAKLANAGFRGAKLATEQGPKALQYLNTFLKGFRTGATYEGGKQAVNAGFGDEVDIGQIPITGSLFGLGESFFKGLGELGSKFKKLSPKHQAEILEQGLIPKDLPKSQFETAESMLKAVQQQQQKRFPFNRFPPDGGPPPPPGAPPSGGRPPSLTNRVSRRGNDLGLRPVTPTQNPSLPDRVGNIFSPNRFYNTTQGGQAFQNEIREIDQNVYRGVNDLYRRSRTLNRNIEDIQPDLAQNLQNRINDLSEIPEPSDVQRRLLRASQNILNDIAIVDENGVITGYTPINNQVLIEQVQSLRQIIDHDFAHGNTKNIFRPLINELQDAALISAQNSGTPEAATALNEARNAYRTWVEAFDNDYVRPFRNTTNHDASKLFKSSLEVDELNMLRRVLNTSERGQELVNASTRELVEKNLGKYFENPRGVNARDFDKALRELEAVITPEQSQEIRAQFTEAARRPGFKATSRVQKPTNEEIIAGKYLGKEPEYVIEKMNTRSGIRELREDFKGSETKRELFDTLSKKKMRSVLRDGNIEKEFTGDDLYKFLNKEKNYEIFSELLGEEETEALRLSAKQIGKEQVKEELKQQNRSKLLNKAATYKSMQLLLSII